MNLLATNTTVQKQNRFPWGRFLGITVVIFTITILIKTIPDYIENHYFHVKNGEFVQVLDGNLQDALATVSVNEGEINASTLAPSITLHCGDYFERGAIDTPRALQNCEAEYGYIAFHNISEYILTHRFTKLMIFDGTEPTFTVQMERSSSIETLPQQILSNSYLEGSLVDSEWRIEGMKSNLIVPIYNEAETAVIGAIFIETPPPSGYFDLGFLAQITTFYLPFALLLAYVGINLQKSRRNTRNA